MYQLALRQAIVDPNKICRNDILACVSAGPKIRDLDTASRTAPSLGPFSGLLLQAISLRSYGDQRLSRISPAGPSSRPAPTGRQPHPTSRSSAQSRMSSKRPPPDAKRSSVRSVSLGQRYLGAPRPAIEPHEFIAVRKRSKQDRKRSIVFRIREMYRVELDAARVGFTIWHCFSSNDRFSIAHADT